MGEKCSSELLKLLEIVSARCMLKLNKLTLTQPVMYSENNLVFSILDVQDKHTQPLCRSYRPLNIDVDWVWKCGTRNICGRDSDQTRENCEHKQEMFLSQGGQPEDIQSDLSLLQ